MKLTLLPVQILPVTLLAIGLAGCGGGYNPADNNSSSQGSKPEGQTGNTPKSTAKVELAAFIKGKRVWMVKPDYPPTPEEEQPEIKGEESSPRKPQKNEDGCEGPASNEKEEMFFQFNEDGTIQGGARDENGEPEAFPDGDLTYVVKGLEVIVSENDEELKRKKKRKEGIIYFGSHEPKAGDEISFAEPGVEVEKINTKITKIEPATKLKEMEIPPDPNAKEDGQSEKK